MIEVKIFDNGKKMQSHSGDFAFAVLNKNEIEISCGIYGESNPIDGAKCITSGAICAIKRLCRGDEELEKTLKMASAMMFMRGIE